MIDYLRQFNLASVLLRLTLAVVCGGLIGVNREHKRRPAGFRTYMMVCMGAALSMILGQYEDTMLHTLNGVLCAAIGFSLVDLLNRSTKISTFSLSPVYMAVVAFCFSMTVGVMWEFFECAMDRFFLLDMQKDAIMNTISSVMLDPAGGNTPVIIQDIADVIIVHSDGTQQALGLGGYLDVGIWDTMKDLFVNFIGATVFSIIGYFYVKQRGKGKLASSFIPRRREDLLPTKDRR